MIELIENFRHPIILMSFLIATVYVFGFDTFPIIQDHTRQVVIAALCFGVLVYFLVYMHGNKEEEYYTQPTYLAGQSQTQIVATTKVNPPSFKELERKEDQIIQRSNKIENDVFKRFDEVKR